LQLATVSAAIEERQNGGYDATENIRGFPQGAVNPQ